MCRAFIPLMLKGGDKTIVTTTSAKTLARIPNDSAYQTTKEAQLMLKAFLTVGFGEQGLAAYCIHPDSVKTELAHEILEYMRKILDEWELVGDTLVWLTTERRPWLADKYINLTSDMEDIHFKRKEI